jgi:hypothetical protein
MDLLLFVLHFTLRVAPAWLCRIEKVHKIHFSCCDWSASLCGSTPEVDRIVSAMKVTVSVGNKRYEMEHMYLPRCPKNNLNWHTICYEQYKRCLFTVSCHGIESGFMYTITLDTRRLTDSGAWLTYRHNVSQQVEHKYSPAWPLVVDCPSGAVSRTV